MIITDDNNDDEFLCRGSVENKTTVLWCYGVNFSVFLLQLIILTPHSPSYICPPPPPQEPPTDPAFIVTSGLKMSLLIDSVSVYMARGHQPDWFCVNSLI